MQSWLDAFPDSVSHSYKQKWESSIGSQTESIALTTAADYGEGS